MALPVLSTGDISAAVTSFGMQFQDVWDNTFSWVDKCATILPMASSTIKMPWQQVLPQMRAWLGNRKVEQMVANEITYTAQTFELTTGLSRDDAEDDLIGLWLAVTPARLAREIKRQPEVMLSQLLESNPNTFDGVSFFSASHPIDSSKPGSPTTNSNIRLGTTDGYLTADNVNALQAQIMELQGPDGTPVNFFASTLMVRPTDALLARNIAYGKFFPTALNSSASGSNVVAQGPVSNEMQGFVEVVVNPYLTQNRWYLFCTDAGISPLLWFERVAPEIEYRVAPSDWNVFDQNTYLVGARRRAVPGLGLYYMAGVATPEASLPSIPLPLPIQ